MNKRESKLEMKAAPVVNKTPSAIAAFNINSDGESGRAVSSYDYVESAECSDVIVPDRPPSTSG